MRMNPPDLNHAQAAMLPRIFRVLPLNMHNKLVETSVHHLTQKANMGILHLKLFLNKLMNFISLNIDMSIVI